MRLTTLYRFVAASLCVVFSGHVFAWTPSGEWHAYWNSGYVVGSSAATACTAAAHQQFSGSPNAVGYVQASGMCRQAANQNNYDTWFWIEFQDVQVTTSACTADETGFANFTVGWTNVHPSYQPPSGNYVGVVAPGITLPSGTVCFQGCAATVGTPTDAWISAQATSQGLYRMSMDYQLTATGATCGTTTAAADPGQSSPPCPGVSGTVNGKTVCLTSSAPSSAPNPATQGTYTGNPPAGSGAASAPSERTPATGSGGPSGGGSGAGSGGGVGGASSGQQAPSSTPAPKDPCGIPGSSACKIDETGTPDGTGITSASNAAKSAGDALLAGVQNVTKPSSLGWSFGITIPEGSCTDFQFYKPGGTWSVGLCSNSTVLLVRSMLAWAFGIFACVYCYRRVTGTLSSEG